MPFGGHCADHDQELADKDKFEPRGSSGVFADYAASGPSR